MDLDQLPWSRYIQLHTIIPSLWGDLVKIPSHCSNAYQLFTTSKDLQIPILARGNLFWNNLSENQTTIKDSSIF